MICTDVQIYNRTGRRFLPDNENDIKMLLTEPENLMRVACSTEVSELMALFDENGAAFISITNSVDGKTRYIDNGNGDEEPLELMGNDCPAGKMMCYDKKEAADIILHFCNTGNLHPKFKWIES